MIHDAPTTADMNDRNATILIIRRELRRRSGKSWSVTGGRGTAWGWITIHLPPARRDEHGCMSEHGRLELAALLGLPARLVNCQGLQIPAGPAATRHRIDYIRRARSLISTAQDGD